MAITVNTNIASLVAQNNLNAATNGMNKAMERMSTGYRINSSKDDAAGMAISSKLDYKISSLAVAQDNVQLGKAMLDTAEGVLNVVQKNLVRIRDLVEQASSGTYGTDAKVAIKAEIDSRITEMDRALKASEFNGVNLFASSSDVKIQAGINKADSVIDISTAFGAPSDTYSLAATKDSDSSAWADELAKVDKAIAGVTDKMTKMGGFHAQLDSAMETANVMAKNFKAANSLIKDADIAVESSNYIKNQILQQSAATLLATANQAPGIALNLV